MMPFSNKHEQDEWSFVQFLLYLNVVPYNGDIFEVQGSINLVHDIEWCGFVMV